MLFLHFNKLNQLSSMVKQVPVLLWGRMVDEYSEGVCLHCVPVIRPLQYRAPDSLFFKRAKLFLNVACKKPGHIFLTLPRAAL